MGADPEPGLGPVGARAQDVEEEDKGGDGEDEALDLELGERVALVDVVPLGVGEGGTAGRQRGGSGAGECRRGARGGLGDGIGGSGKVGKV